MSFWCLPISQWRRKSNTTQKELKQFVNRARWGASSFFYSTLFCFDVYACAHMCVYPKAKLEISQASGPGNSTWPVPGEPLDGSRGWLSPSCSCQCWPHSQNSKMLVLTESWHKSPYYYSTEEGEGQSFSSNGFHPATHWQHSYTQSHWTFWSFHFLPLISLQALYANTHQNRRILFWDQSPERHFFFFFFLRGCQTSTIWSIKDLYCPIDLVLILTLPLTSCVALGKSLNLSDLTLLICKNILFWGLRETA